MLLKKSLNNNMFLKGSTKKKNGTVKLVKQLQHR